MNNLYLFVAVAVLLSLRSAYCQQGAANAERPSPPLVSAPPARVHWEITVETEKKPAPGDAMSARPHPVSMEMKKTGDVAHLIETWSNGKSSESWIAEGYILNKWPALPDIYVTRLDSRGAVLDDGQSDFNTQYPGFTWLEERYYRGNEKLEGSLCYHYADPENERESWVDQKTNRPVAFRRRSLRYIYHFRPPPKGELQMASTFQKELDRYIKADRR